MCLLYSDSFIYEDLKPQPSGMWTSKGKVSNWKQNNFSYHQIYGLHTYGNTYAENFPKHETVYNRSTRQQIDH